MDKIFLVMLLHVKVTIYMYRYVWYISFFRSCILFVTKKFSGGDLKRLIFWNGSSRTCFFSNAYFQENCVIPLYLFTVSRILVVWVVLESLDSVYFINCWFFIFPISLFVLFVIWLRDLRLFMHGFYKFSDAFLRFDDRFIDYSFHQDALDERLGFSNFWRCLTFFFY